MIDDINLIYETYHLPEIKKDDITESEYNHRCKYLRLYIRLIKRCQSMTVEELSGYTEKHHILPKCLGGDNKKANLVIMPIRYHIITHFVILEVYPDNIDLAYAVTIFINGGKNYQNKKRIEIINKSFSTRTIALVREKAMIPLKSEENKKRISEFMKGRKFSEETKKKLSDGKIGELNPQFGIPKDEEFKEIMSIKMRGSNNPNYGKDYSKNRTYRSTSGSKNGKAKKVVGPDGKIYGSASEAAKENNIKYKTLTKILEKDNEDGWKYLDGPSSKERKLKNKKGEIFNSIKDASKKYGVTVGTINKWLKNKNGFNMYGLKYI